MFERNSLRPLDGGFYHYARLCNGLTADTFNERLFKHPVGVLSVRLCEMARWNSRSPERITRFSFGPLGPDACDRDRATLPKAPTCYPQSDENLA